MIKLRKIHKKNITLKYKHLYPIGDMNSVSYWKDLIDRPYQPEKDLFRMIKYNKWKLLDLSEMNELDISLDIEFTEQELELLNNYYYLVHYYDYISRRIIPYQFIDLPKSEIKMLDDYNDYMAELEELEYDQ